MSFSRTTKRGGPALSVIVSAAMLTTGGALEVSIAAATAPLTGRVVHVNDSDSSWAEQAYECVDGGADLTPRQTMVLGPQRAPFGSGSHRMVVGESTVQTELYRTNLYDDTRLDEITRLAYSTYARPRNAGGVDRQLPYLRISVDNDGDGGRDQSLFFIPANNSEQELVANGQWQHWDVRSGVIGVNGDPGEGLTTIDKYLVAHPDSTLVNNDEDKPTGGAIALIVGCNGGGNSDPQRNGVYFTDRVIVGESGLDTLYDFESVEETQTATVTKVIDPEHLRGWVSLAFDSDSDFTPNQEFVRGPADPPLGMGSLRFAIGGNSDRVEQFRTPRYDDRLLRDMRGLRYSTFQRPFGDNVSPQQPAYLRLSLDNDGDDVRDESIFFIPANNARQGSIQQETWQRWNAYTGRWSIASDTGPADTVTLKSYMVEHPDSRIINNNGGAPSGGGLTVMVGASGENQQRGRFFVDNIAVNMVDAATSTTVSGIRFDLEPSAR